MFPEGLGQGKLLAMKHIQSHNSFRRISHKETNKIMDYNEAYFLFLTKSNR